MRYTRYAPATPECGMSDASPKIGRRAAPNSRSAARAYRLSRGIFAVLIAARVRRNCPVSLPAQTGTQSRRDRKAAPGHIAQVLR